APATRAPSGRRRSGLRPWPSPPRRPWQRPPPPRAYGDSELLLPRLTHQIVAEARVAFLVCAPIAGCLVDAPGREQHAVRPQGDHAVAGRAREPLALRDEPRADADATCGRLDEQQAQLGHGRAALDHEHAPDALAVLLRDPAALARRIVT